MLDLLTQGNDIFHKVMRTALIFTLDSTGCFYTIVMWVNHAQCGEAQRRLCCTVQYK